MLFGAFPSLKTLWEENSANAMTLSGSVHGWWTLPKTKVEYAGMSFNTRLFTLLDDAISVADTNGVQLSNNDRLLLFFNDDLACGCAVATVGMFNRTTPYGDRVISAAWFPGEPNQWSWTVHVTGHEYGHNLGWFHSGNVYTTYDSPWDVVSGGCADGPHTHAFNKVDAGWLGADGLLLPRGTMSVFTVLPTTRSSGLRALTLDMPDGNHSYSVESRVLEGHDGCVPSAGVIIHIWHREQVDPDWRKKPVDATPGDGTLSNAQWTPGMTFTDPANGLTIQILGQKGDGSFDVLVFWPEPLVGCLGTPIPITGLPPLPSASGAPPHLTAVTMPPVGTPAPMPVPNPCN